jgi:hypothetical protein
MTHSRRPTYVPPEVEAIVIEAVREGYPAHRLVEEGHADNVRSAQRWMQGVRTDNYTTETSPGHPYTKPQTDNIITVQKKLLETQDKFRALLGRYAQSPEGVHGVSTGDEHVPDENPVYVELACLVGGAWLSGQTNQLHVKMGDTADFKDESTYRSMPAHFMRPGHPVIADPMTLTMLHMDNLHRNYKSAMPDASTVEISANHTKRFFYHVSQTLHADWSALGFLNYLDEMGVMFLGPDEDRVILRADKNNQNGFKLLHGDHARGQAGQSIAQTMLADGFVHEVTAQVHVHRSAEYSKSRGDGSVSTGFEIGHLCNSEPWYTRANQNWQSGMAVWWYHPTDFSIPVEFHNIKFRKTGTYMSALLMGNEYRVKIPQTQIAITRTLKGDFRPLRQRSKKESAA